MMTFKNNNNVYLHTGFSKETKKIRGHDTNLTSLPNNVFITTAMD
jgi:hypothetical protein